jgi:hypothetical protein
MYIMNSLTTKSDRNDKIFDFEIMALVVIGLFQLVEISVRGNLFNLLVIMLGFRRVKLC